jgi:HK97 family phage portal protein
MRTSAVYACVKILAETVASLPLQLFKKTGKDGSESEKAANHPLYDCLYQTANGENSSFSFREIMMTSLLLWGNAYARVVRDGHNHVCELWYLRPDRVTVDRDLITRQLKYEYTDDYGKLWTYSPSQIFHVKGLSFDGVKGLSPISQMREAVGLSIAAEQYGARFFGNNARPGGIIEHPGAIKDPETFRKKWNDTFQGVLNSNKIVVLEEGMKFQAIGLPPGDSQFLETRKFQINEICRIFRVPPHLVGDLEKATFSNIEHQSIEFVQHTIRPWLVRWEQEIHRSLLTEAERSVYYAKFNVDGLLRGDYKSRMDGYAVGRQYGWMSANDVRKLEELPPLPKGQAGDEYMVLANMVPAKMAGKKNAPTAPQNLQVGGEKPGNDKEPNNAEGVQNPPPNGAADSGDGGQKNN